MQNQPSRQNTINLRTQPRKSLHQNIFYLKRTYHQRKGLIFNILSDRRRIKTQRALTISQVPVINERVNQPGNLIISNGVLNNVLEVNKHARVTTKFADLSQQ